MTRSADGLLPTLLHAIWRAGFRVGVCLVLAACASRPTLPGWQAPDCAAAQSRCHEGRFGLTYRIERSDGTQADAINGTWRWESTADQTGSNSANPHAARPADHTGRQPGEPTTTQTADTPPSSTFKQGRAQLELSNVLGVRLATVRQSGRLLLLTDGQGRQYRARDWDDLFFSLFELRLPGQAIAGWMAEGANPQSPPVLDQAGWQTDTNARRLRMTWQSDTGQIRLDLIPDQPSP